eukprot:PhF_6_TR42423/c0_g1_i1/m.63985
MSDDPEVVAAKQKKLLEDLKHAINKVKSEKEVSIVAHYLQLIFKAEDPAAKKLWYDSGGIGIAINLLRNFTVEKILEQQRQAEAQKLEEEKLKAAAAAGGGTEGAAPPAPVQPPPEKAPEKHPPAPVAPAKGAGKAAAGKTTAAGGGGDKAEKEAAKAEPKIEKIDPIVGTQLVRTLALTSIQSLPPNTIKYNTKYQQEIFETKGVELMLDLLHVAAAEVDEAKREKLGIFGIQPLCNTISQMVYGVENIAVFNAKNGQDVFLRIVKEFHVMTNLPF